MACGSVFVLSFQWEEALSHSTLFPTVRALQDNLAEGGSEVLVEEREDDCPHLCGCFYHHPLNRALRLWCHPLSDLGSPSHLALLFLASPHGGHPEGPSFPSNSTGTAAQSSVPSL